MIYNLVGLTFMKGKLPQPIYDLILPLKTMGNLENRVQYANLF